MNFNKVQKRRGIGNVITTLIILIASVVLGAGVIFFGGSMFQTNTQSESIKVSNVHSWVETATDDAATAFVVQNTGSKAVTVSSINLRGVSVPTAMWNYALTDSVTELQNELQPFYTTATLPAVGGNPGYLVGEWDTGTVSLDQGEAAIVYVIPDAGGNNPGNMAQIDTGNTYSLQIQTGQATAVQQVQVLSD